MLSGVRDDQGSPGGDGVLTDRVLQGGLAPGAQVEGGAVGADKELVIGVDQAYQGHGRFEQPRREPGEPVEDYGDRLAAQVQPVERGQPAGVAHRARHWFGHG